MNFKTLTLMGTILCALSSPSAEAKTGNFLQHSKPSLSKKPTVVEVIDFAKSKSMLHSNSKKASYLKNAKTTATKSRVIAYAYRDFTTLGPNDTLKFFYSSPNRGSDIPNQILQYDSLLAYTYDMSAGAYVRDFYDGQTFDASDNVLTSTEKNWNDVTMSYENSSRTSYVYNSSNKIVSMISESWDGSIWENSSKNVYVYDAAQNKLKDTSFNWNGTAWEPSYVEVNTYTATNKIASSMFYFYESTTSTWLNVFSTSYTYDASNFLISSLTKVLDMTTLTLEDNSRVTFTNDISGNPTTTLQENWDAGASAWKNSSRTFNTYDAANNVLTDLYSNWNDFDGKFDTSSLYQNGYNSYNQIQTEVYNRWDNTTASWTKEDSSTYYYELHTPTSIVEIAKNSASKVYPIPANNEFTVSANIGEAQKIQMILSDIQGRPFVQMSHQSGADFNQKISVSNIPTGNYILSINGDKGFRSVQKITVAH